MNIALNGVLIYLSDRKIIGKKHTPEDKLIKRKTKWLDKKVKKDFENEYKKMINEGFIIRIKKRTGKGSDWHISLNPRRLKEINEMVNYDV